MPVQLTRLARLVELPGPYATALLDVSRAAEDADHQLELRAQGARDGLIAEGAPEALSDEIRRRLIEHTGLPGAVGRFVAGTSRGVAVDDPMPQWEGPDIVAFGPLPDVTEWLAYLGATTSVLLILADKAGADLSRYDAWDHGGPGDRQQVTGETLHLHKVPDDDLAKTTLQRTTEEVWRINARKVADELERMVGTSHPMIVLAGDPKARSEIREAAGDSVRPGIIEAEHGSRAAGTSDSNLDAEVRRLVQNALVEQRLAAVRDYQERVGRDEGVARGVDDVLDACAMGRAGTVLVDRSTAPEVLIRPADHPGVPLPSSALEAPNVRGDLAVLAAAAATDAEAEFVGSSALGGDYGAAALLRWT